MRSNIYNILSALSYTEIRVRFTTRDKQKIEGWIGAHIRNRFLYCAESITVRGGDTTLREVLSTECPLSESHPLYNELKGGFPKGYVIKIYSIDYDSGDSDMSMFNSFDFSIVLIGDRAAYRMEAIEAVELLADSGIMGVKFSSEISHIESFSLGDFMEFPYSSNVLKISIATPMSLYKNKVTKSTQDSYQAKMNGLPTLYQITQSAAHRIAKLGVLYSGIMWSRELVAGIESITNISTLPLITECNIYRGVIHSSKRISDGQIMNFDGIVGTMAWSGKVDELIPLLSFCSKISLGDDTVYGMGNFNLK